MNILFVFNLGSELRQFSHSGLIQKLIERDYKVYISSKHIDADFRAEIPERVNLLPYYRDNHSVLFNIINQAIERSFPVKFRYGKPLKKKLKDYVLDLFISAIASFLKCNLFRKAFIKIERYILFNSFNKNWHDLLIKYKIDEIITNVPNMNLTLHKEAIKMGIKRLLIYHTNKDIIAVNRIVLPYTKYGVWNTEMKHSLVSKFNLPEKDVFVLGCLHFSYLGKKIEKRKEIAKPTETTNPIFVYICAADNIINEEIIVGNLIDNLYKVYDNKFTLYLRDNPMSTTNKWQIFQNDNVIVQKPLWYFNKKENFNYAKKQDLEEFKMLLENSTAIFGLPSTVVIEANLCDKPFFNIFSDDSRISVTNIDGKLRDLWNLDFYYNARKFSAAIPVYNEDELFNVLANLKKNVNYYSNPNRLKYLKEEIDLLNFDESIERHCAFIELKL